MGLSRPLVVCSALLLAIVDPLAQGSSPAVPGRSARSAVIAEAPIGDPEHGRYLVEQVAMCVECHSPRDDKGEIVAGQEYTGAPIPFRPPWPNDWAQIAPRNRGLPGYTDELGIRLLTQGSIGRDGTQLRLPMPRFRMTPRDAADVIAFMRSLD